MGREIRQVPANWEHPKNEQGFYRPLQDQDYESLASQWLIECVAWQDGTHEDLKAEPDIKLDIPFYWEWAGEPPNREHCRPKWTDAERTHFQIYETVSEGTPVSPVFASLDSLTVWLIEQGYSKQAAIGFAKVGYVPSMMVGPNGIKTGINIAEDF